MLRFEGNGCQQLPAVLHAHSWILFGAQISIPRPPLAQPVKYVPERNAYLRLMEVRSAAHAPPGALMECASHLAGRVLMNMVLANLEVIQTLILIWPIARLAKCVNFQSAKEQEKCRRAALAWCGMMMVLAGKTVGHVFEETVTVLLSLVMAQATLLVSNALLRCTGDSQCKAN